MRARTIPLLLAVALVALSGCGTAHTARPLGKGNTAVNVSLGGPFAEVGGATVPIPLPTVGVKHGVSERNDLYASWQVLPAIMGSFAFDVGGSWYFLDQRKALPGLSTALTLHSLFNEHDAWFAADTQLIASWLLHPRHLLYLGFHLTFVPIEGEVMQTSPVHFSPLLGGEVRLGKHKRFGLGLELKWLDPWVDTEMGIVDYVGTRGGLCLSGGFNFYLGDGSERRARREQTARRERR
jgi:hypothetical protein